MNNVQMLWLVFVVYCYYGSGQVVKRVNVKNHKEYLQEVIQETVYTLEERQWNNLRLADVTTTINEKILGKQYKGDATYKNGFLVSIQELTVQPRDINQDFRPEEDGTVTVRIWGKLKMVDVAVGYDVVTDLGGSIRHYTAVFTHKTLEYEFSVLRNTNTLKMSVSVSLTNSAPSLNKVKILPRDDVSDVLTTLFNNNIIAKGVEAWASEVFQPIALDIITNRVEFPTYCYNCPN